MWVINNNKARSLTYIKNDLRDLITQLTNEDNEVSKIVSALNNALGGEPSGACDRMIDSCKRSQSSLGDARRTVYTCMDYASQLEIREWVDDEQYR